jgi:hypothetical protein
VLCRSSVERRVWLLEVAVTVHWDGRPWRRGGTSYWSRPNFRSLELKWRPYLAVLQIGAFTHYTSLSNDRCNIAQHYLGRKQVRLSFEGRWDGTDMGHAWERWEMYTKF